MIVLTEGKHAGEFIVSEANGHRSREIATVLSGENLVAGQVVQRDGAGKLVAAAGAIQTDGSLATEVAGILWTNVDASPTGADADVTGQVLIARDAEVNDAEITYPAESTAGGEKAATVASLAKLGIIAR